MDWTNTYSALFPLLRSGLWKHPFPEMAVVPLTDEQWENVYEESVRQTVTGVIFEGLKCMPDEYLPDENLLAKWAAASDRVERYNKRMNDTLTVV